MMLSDFLLQDIKLKHSKIVYLDIDIDMEKPFEDQHWSYKEDMLQIKFDNNYIIDLGWSPEHEKKGFFILTVVKNFNWHKPLLRKKIRSISYLKKNLENQINKLELINARNLENS